MERPPDVLDHRRHEPGGHDRRRWRRQTRHDRGERGSVRDDHRRRQPPGGAELHAQAIAQTRAKIRVPLVPPKPNEFDSAARIGISRAWSGT